MTTSTRQHGGAREGAGRPMATDPRLTQSVCLRASLVAWLDARARLLGVSKSALVDRIIDEYRLRKSTGIEK